MPKIRLDQLVMDRGMAESRTKAQALIMSGKVMRGTERLTKPGMSLPEDTEIVLEGKEHPWVSRGGMKLAHGLEHFEVNPAGMTCIDVGASTGGFTDVLLHHGAAKVYAVDVGHGQLDIKLREDARVVVMEKTNARHLTAEQIPEPVDLVVCDASFISLKTVLPAAMALAAPPPQSSPLKGEEASVSEQEGMTNKERNEKQEARSVDRASPERERSEPPIAQGSIPERGQLIALIKPQFEAGKKHLRKGVVRDVEVHQAVCDDIRHWLDNEMGWTVIGIEESPVRGPKGNIEFLIYAVK